MFPRATLYLAAPAAAAIAVTTVFWIFAPELRFADPKPKITVARTGMSVHPAGTAIAPAPLPAQPYYDEAQDREARSEQASPIVGNNQDEIRQGFPETLSHAIRQKLPETELSDEDIQELVEAIGILRKSMQSLREMERIPENAAAIRDLMNHIEANHRRFEKTTGMSTAEFVRRTTTNGIDNGRRNEDTVALETLDGPGR